MTTFWKIVSIFLVGFFPLAFLHLMDPEVSCIVPRVFAGFRVTMYPTGTVFRAAVFRYEID